MIVILSFAFASFLKLDMLSGEMAVQVSDLKFALPKVFAFVPPWLTLDLQALKCKLCVFLNHGEHSQSGEGLCLLTVHGSTGSHCWCCPEGSQCQDL